jgi:hypothetical protein
LKRALVVRRALLFLGGRRQLDDLHEPHIDQMEVRLVEDCDLAAFRAVRDVFGMCDQDRSAAAQVQLKRLERPPCVQRLDLSGGRHRRYLFG